MRYSELLEYKRDITATNLGKQLIDRLSKEPTIRGDVGSIVGDLLNPRFPDSTYNYTLETGVVAILKLFEDVDPTPNKQYTEWLVRRYIDGSIVRFEDVLSTWADLLNEFHRLKTRRLLPPELMDINKFKTEQDLKQLHKSVLDIFNSTDEKVEVQKGESTEILNNSEVRIIIPEDQKAACYYGQGTRWCTAAKNNNMFGGYSSHNHPLFILLPKNPTHDGEKYQVHLLENEWMDEEDTEVGAQEVIERFSNTDLKSVFEKYDTDANLILDFLSWRTITYTIDEITELIVKNKNVILSDWLSDTTQGNINAHRKIIDGMSSLHPTDEILDAMWENYGEWRMKLYELPDAYAKWLEYEFHIDGGFYDFVHGNIEATVDSKGQPIVRIG